MKKFLAALALTAAVTSFSACQQLPMSPSEAAEAHAGVYLATIATRWVAMVHITATKPDGTKVEAVEPQYYNKADWPDEDACKAALGTDERLKSAVIQLGAVVAQFNADHPDTKLELTTKCEPHDVPNSDKSSS